MEIQLNKDLKKCTEQVFIGMTWRQSIFSIVGCVLSVGAYFLLKDYLGTELVTWVCVFVVLPCAAFGFIEYHGMSFEVMVRTFVRNLYCILPSMPYHLENIYYEADKPKIEAAMKKEARRRD